VLVGFGDGEVQHIDVRVTDRMYLLSRCGCTLDPLCDSLNRFQDPFVGSISTLEYNAEARMFLACGAGKYASYCFSVHF